jgi:hypothetical protein
MTDHDSGYVRPLPADGIEDAYDPAPPSPRKRRRGLIIGGTVLGVLIAGAVGAAIAWNALVGSAFASAEAVPIDADIVVTFDLLQVRDSERVDRLIRAFTRPAAEQGMIDDGEFDLFAEIDEAMEAESGLSIGDDVVPWIGRSLSLAVWFNGNPGSPDFDENDVGAVLVSGVRNHGAAEDFVAKAARAAAREVDGSVESSRLGDGEVTIVTVDDPTLDDAGVDGLVMYLENDLMIMGARERDIERALDARNGESILDHDAYQSVIDALPSDRLMAGYMDMAWIENVYREQAELLGPDADLALDTVEAYEGFGMAFTIHDAGLRFDGVALIEPGAEVPIGSLDAADLRFPGRLPDETLAMVAAPLPENVISDAVESFRDFDPGLYDEAVGEANDLLGFDLVDDLLDHLGREVVLALVTTPDGLLAEQTGVNIGAVFGIGVTDADAVGDAVARLEDLAFENGLDVQALGSSSVVRADGQQVFGYGLSDEELVIGTGPTVVEAVLDASGSSLDANPRYARLDDVLPGSGLPVFIDLQGFFDAFDWNGPERAVVDPLQAIGMSGDESGNVLSYSMFVLIDY